MRDYHVFPRVTQLGQQAPGMELRDWFAGMALNGMLAEFMSDPHVESSLDSKVYARFAYEYADAMIERRDKEQN
jgi:hypothetical protein